MNCSNLQILEEDGLQNERDLYLLSMVRLAERYLVLLEEYSAFSPKAEKIIADDIEHCKEILEHTKVKVKEMVNRLGL